LSGSETPERRAGEVDLGGLFTSRSGVTLTTPIPEEPAQRDHRIRQEGWDNRLRRFKEGVTFVLGWAVIVSIAAAAARVAFDDAPPQAAAASWGRTILGSLMGALAGYVIGRKS
jgi:hypothetical protein